MFLKNIFTSRDLLEKREKYSHLHHLFFVYERTLLILIIGAMIFAIL